MRCWLFVPAVVACVGCGDVDLDVVAPRRDTIVDGSVDTLHDGVVAMVTRGGNLRCSGTVIHERVVLTAAHCVSGVDLELYRIAFGVDGDETPVAIEKGHVHPGWPGPDDLALLALAEPVPSNVTVHRYADPLNDPAAVGLDVEVVGFGRTDSQTTGAGTRNNGTARITIVDELSFAFDPTPSSICFGDSGGPTFASVGAGDDVIGVHSRTLDAQCEMRGFDVRVAAYAEDFIRPIVAELDRPATGEAKSCDCRATSPLAPAFLVVGLWSRRWRRGGASERHQSSEPVRQDHGVQQ